MDTNIKTPSPITFQESKLKTIWIVLRFDLLKNLYLCGIINNSTSSSLPQLRVVICS